MTFKIGELKLVSKWKHFPFYTKFKKRITYININYIKKKVR
jgi:hypothetical protein